MRYSIISILFFNLFFLGQMKAFSQDKVKGVIVEFCSGKKMEFRLDDHPKFVYDGKTIKLTADGVLVEFVPLDLLKLTMGEVSNVNSGIGEQTSEKNDIKVDANFIRLNGFITGDAVTIYSSNGAKQAEYRIGQDGSLIIPISSLTTGISIIKTNKQSIKILR